LGSKEKKGNSCLNPVEGRESTETRNRHYGKSITLTGRGEKEFPRESGPRIRREKGEGVHTQNPNRLNARCPKEEKGAAESNLKAAGMKKERKERVKVPT